MGQWRNSRHIYIEVICHCSKFHKINACKAIFSVKHFRWKAPSNHRFVKTAIAQEGFEPWTLGFMIIIIHKPRHQSTVEGC